MDIKLWLGKLCEQKHHVITTLELNVMSNKFLKVNLPCISRIKNQLDKYQKLLDCLLIYTENI